MKNKKRTFKKSGIKDYLKNWYFKDKKKFNNWNFFVAIFSIIVVIAMLVVMLAQPNIKTQMIDYPLYWIIWVVIFLVFLYNLVRWSLNLKRITENKIQKKQTLISDSQRNLTWQEQFLNFEQQKIKQQKFQKKKGKR